MATNPTQFNFNGTTPAAPEGSILCGFQTDMGSPIQNISMTVPIATDAAPGVVQPDGTTVTISNGVISATPTETGNATEIQGVAVAPAAPTSGQVLQYTGSEWAPTTQAATADAGEIQGVPVSPTAPTTGEVLTYNGTEWQPATPTGGGGGGTGVGSIQFGTTNPNGANTPALIQSASGSKGPGSMTLDLSSVAVGNLILVYYGGNDAPTVSDTLGTEYALLASNSGQGGFALYGGISTVAGSCIVTITASGDGNGFVAQFSNVTLTIDVGPIYSSGSGSSTAAASLTSTKQNDLLILLEEDGAGGLTMTPSSGFTKIAQENPYWDSAWAYQIAANAEEYNGVWTLSGSAGYVVTLIALAAVSNPIAGATGDLYFQTGGGSYVGFVYNDGVWNQIQ